jgi:hypothetical protein
VAGEAAVRFRTPPLRAPNPAESVLSPGTFYGPSAAGGYRALSSSPIVRMIDCKALSGRTMTYNDTML